MWGRRFRLPVQVMWGRPFRLPVQVMWGRRFRLPVQIYMPDYRRRLPHIHPPGVFLFITFRLSGSSPASLTSDSRSCGPHWLDNPAIASIVAEAIERGEHEFHFYSLRAWIVMPNHVHLLVLPTGPVSKFMRWIKGSTARRANQLLGRTGCPFWQDESFDHWIRNEAELDQIVRYVEENPVTAGLVPSAELWRWSSLGWRAKAATTRL
jgi:putative DNA methylase